MGVLSKKDNVDQFGRFNKRSKNDCMECWSKIGSSGFNLSVDHNPVHKQLLLSHKPLIAPPPLHILLGLINSIFESIEKNSVLR